MHRLAAMRLTFHIQADRSGNCNPGLVVDSGIVHSKLMDFYLQSHSGIIGSEYLSSWLIKSRLTLLQRAAPATTSF